MMNYDVFLAHNSSDKPAVQQLAERLRDERGLSVWFDVWSLRPGMPSQPQMEDGIRQSSAGVVLIGKDGMGPWEDREMQALLNRAVNQSIPVIPVLLPGAPEKPELPLFLESHIWVDLRDGFKGHGIDLLMWGIKGVNPNSPSVPASVGAPPAEGFRVKAKRTIDNLKSEITKKMESVSADCRQRIDERFLPDYEKRSTMRYDFVDWLVMECHASNAVSRLNGIAREPGTSPSDASTLSQIASRLIPLRYADKMEEVREQLESNTFEIITSTDRPIAEVVMASFDGMPIRFHRRLGVTAFEFLESGDYGYGEEQIDARVTAFFSDILNAWDKRFGEYLQQSTGDSLQDLARKLKARVLELEAAHDRTVYCLLKLPSEKTQREELEAVLQRAATFVPNLVFCHVLDRTDDEDELLLACISRIPE